MDAVIQSFLTGSPVLLLHFAVTVAMLSADENIATIRLALQLGAAGYIPKTQPPDELCRAVDALIAATLSLIATRTRAGPTSPASMRLGRSLSRRSAAL